MITPAIASARKADTVSSTSLEYDQMALEWDIVTDFLGNTRTLRELQTKWLPRMKKERLDNYRRRIEVSYLYPMFRNTIASIVARPFSREIQIGEPGLPARLAQLEWNADGRGSTLTQFGRSVFWDAVAYGKSHILAEFPPGEPGETSQDQARVGKSPFLTHIPAKDLIDWNDHVDDRTGSRILDEIRFRDQETIPRGKYLSEVRDVIRVIRADGTWEKWSRKLTGRLGVAYALEQEGTHSLREIPMATIYTKWRDHMTCEPPLLDLAWLNAAHFRCYSRQLWHEEFLRTPVFMRRGWSPEEIAAGVDIGASEGIGSTNPNATAEWVEASGTSATVGREGIRAIEDRAEVLGHQHMVSRTGDVRATAVAVDEAKIDNNVQAWIRALESVLLQAIEHAGRFVGEAPDPKLTINVWSDFSIEAKSAGEIPQLIALKSAGAITTRTLLAEVRRRGLLPSDFDVDAEAALIDAQGPPLASIGYTGDAGASSSWTAGYGSDAAATVYGV